MMDHFNEEGELVDDMPELDQRQDFHFELEDDEVIKQV